MQPSNQLAILATAAALAMSGMSEAQETAASEAGRAEETQATAAPTEATLLTDAELKTLVAPVALYPDTLLIQILVGTTVPLDVMKADRLLLENSGASPEDMKPVI